MSDEKPKRKKLYIVEVSAEMPIWAENQREAEDLAIDKRYEADNFGASTDLMTKSNSWPFSGAYAWGSEEELTCDQLLVKSLENIEIERLEKEQGLLGFDDKKIEIKEIPLSNKDKEELATGE